MASLEKIEIRLLTFPMRFFVFRLALISPFEPGAISSELRSAAVQPQPLLNRMIRSVSVPVFSKVNTCVNSVSVWTSPKSTRFSSNSIRAPSISSA